MVKIKGGAFNMGSPGDEPGRNTTNENQHPVTVSGFYMSKSPVTQELYAYLTGDTPSSFAGTNLPVERVTWYDAAEFCNKLSDASGLDRVYTITGRTPAGTEYPITSATVTADWTKKGYRLPTEAEWEYAC
ncbi:MAG: formylglycine-generating enzyme family protein, partial [Leptospirales bacterium]|nr:formylglycine-generating enzyme family protein [Leptospirales bacterium]